MLLLTSTIKHYHEAAATMVVGEGGRGGGGRGGVITWVLMLPIMTLVELASVVISLASYIIVGTCLHALTLFLHLSGHEK